MTKQNSYSNFLANFDRDSINNLYSDPGTSFYSDFDMGESRNKTKTKVTIHQAPPEPTCTYVEKKSNTPSKTLLPLPTTPARWDEMVEQDEAIQQDANQDDLHESVNPLQHHQTWKLLTRKSPDPLENRPLSLIKLGNWTVRWVLQCYGGKVEKSPRQHRTVASRRSIKEKQKEPRQCQNTHQILFCQTAKRFSLQRRRATQNFLRS